MTPPRAAASSNGFGLKMSSPSPTTCFFGGSAGTSLGGGLFPAPRLAVSFGVWVGFFILSIFLAAQSQPLLAFSPREAIVLMVEAASFSAFGVVGIFPALNLMSPGGFKPPGIGKRAPYGSAEGSLPNKPAYMPARWPKISLIPGRPPVA